MPNRRSSIKEMALVAQNPTLTYMAITAGDANYAVKQMKSKNL